MKKTKRTYKAMNEENWHVLKNLKTKGNLENKDIQTLTGFSISTISRAVSSDSWDEYREKTKANSTHAKLKVAQPNPTQLNTSPSSDTVSDKLDAVIARLDKLIDIWEYKCPEPEVVEAPKEEVEKVKVKGLGIFGR